MSIKYKYISFTLLAVISTIGKAERISLSQPLKLVVNINIDQLRSDYLEAFSPLYGENGFKKILTGGLVYTNASYPFSPIDRASAVAAVATGTSPYYNSIVGEKWLDKESLRPIYCVDDKKSKGIETKDCSSPKNISVSTLSDELMVASNGKSIIFSISPSRDAAILSGGHAANGALWIDDDNGKWCSSTYYFETAPQWLTAFNNYHSPANSIDTKKWEPASLLSGNFSYFMGGGSQKPFKHKFEGPRRFREFKSSGLVNEEVTSIARQCVLSNGMGLDAIPDLLILTYFAGNFDKRPLSECQMELQDTYVRLDKEIGKLVTDLENKFGKENLLFLITSTGYCTEDNSDYKKYKVPSGTFYVNRTADLLNMYFGAIWGQGKYVEACFGTQFFLNHKLLEEKKISIAEATDRAKEFLCQFSGVRNAYTSLQLLSNGNQSLFKIKNGFNQERNGDIIIEIAPGWRILNENFLENQVARASFTQIPIIFYGADIKPNKISEHISIDRIAPTLAKAIRIRAPNACSSAPLF